MSITGDWVEMQTQHARKNIRVAVCHTHWARRNDSGASTFERKMGRARTCVKGDSMDRGARVNVAGLVSAFDTWERVLCAGCSGPPVPWNRITGGPTGRRGADRRARVLGAASMKLRAAVALVACCVSSELCVQHICLERTAGWLFQVRDRV